MTNPMYDLRFLLEEGFSFARRHLASSAAPETVVTAYRRGTRLLACFPVYDDDDGRVMVQEGLSMLLGYLEADAYTVVAQRRLWHPFERGRLDEVFVAGGRSPRDQLLDARRVERGVDGTVAALHPHPLLRHPSLGRRMMDLLPPPPRVDAERRQRRLLTAAVMAAATCLDGIPVARLSPEVVAGVIADSSLTET